MSRQEFTVWLSSLIGKQRFGNIFLPSCFKIHIVYVRIFNINLKTQVPKVAYFFFEDAVWRVLLRKTEVLSTKTMYTMHLY